MLRTLAVAVLLAGLATPAFGKDEVIFDKSGRPCKNQSDYDCKTTEICTDMTKRVEPRWQCIPGCRPPVKGKRRDRCPDGSTCQPADGFNGLWHRCRDMKTGRELIEP